MKTRILLSLAVVFLAFAALASPEGYWAAKYKYPQSPKTFQFVFDLTKTNGVYTGNSTDHSGTKATVKATFDGTNVAMNLHPLNGDPDVTFKGEYKSVSMATNAPPIERIIGTWTLADGLNGSWFAVKVPKDFIPKDFGATQQDKSSVRDEPRR